MNFYRNRVLGWLSYSEQHIISLLAKKVKSFGVIVELGSFLGKSSVAWADNAHQTVTIYCIDVFPKNWKSNTPLYYKNETPEPNKEYNILTGFIENTKSYPNIKMIQGYSPNNFDQQNQLLFDSINNIDLFFLDALHRNPNDWDNIIHFLPKINSKGIICGHDYNHKDYPDVKTNVERLETMLGIKPTIYQNSSIWSFQLP
jgi:hypothetical protein